MSDTIYRQAARQAAIDAINECHPHCVVPDDYHISIVDAEFRLRKVPSAELEQKWIPVSEIWKLENDEAYSDRVLVQLRKDNVVAIAYYDENALSSDGAYYDTPGWVLDSGKRIVEKDVVRWMPLPESYQGEGEQDE